MIKLLINLRSIFTQNTCSEPLICTIRSNQTAIKLIVAQFVHLFGIIYKMNHWFTILMANMYFLYNKCHMRTVVAHAVETKFLEHTKKMILFIFYVTRRIDLVLSEYHCLNKRIKKNKNTNIRARKACSFHAWPLF